MEPLTAILAYFLVGGAAAVGGVQLHTWWMARHIVGRPAPDLTALLGEAGPPRGRASLYFYSARCTPCEVMTARVERVKGEVPNLVRVDVREHRELTRSLGVTVTPTVLVVEGGRVAAALVGEQSERRLRKVLGIARRRPRG
jgi:hypothetical protein